MIEVTERDGGVTLRVRVVPRASKTAVAGELDGALKIRIASPPVDGEANNELIRFLAKLFSVSRSDVEIISGLASKSKTVRIRGADGSSIQKAIV